MNQPRAARHAPHSHVKVNMYVSLINPASGLPLQSRGDSLIDSAGNSFPVLNGVPRICAPDNYTESFGKQWNAYPLTQIDQPSQGQLLSEARFFQTTQWQPGSLQGQNVLEVGSGAGRFTRVVLQFTEANLWSVDYSSAVEANYKTNQSLAPNRLHLFQASIYEMPFADGSFDKVFCLGVLQHTPDFESSVRALVAKAKIGGEIVVDFYPIKGFWTKIHAKYLLRPLTKRMSHEKLLKLIDRNADRLIGMSRFLDKPGLRALRRFVPVCDIDKVAPVGIPYPHLREWVVLDTFDMFSPAYDNPQRLEDVAEMFRRSGARVTFAGFVDVGTASAAVVRGIKEG
jgi:SAM-dependent methyltransferase